MPVYLCKPGTVWNTEDQGLPVYYQPFCIQDTIRYAEPREQYDPHHAATQNDGTTAHITSVTSRSGGDGGDTTLGRDMGNGTRENSSPPREPNTNGGPTTNNDAAEGDGYNRGRGSHTQFVQPHGNGHPTHYDVNGNPAQQRERGGGIGNSYDEMNHIGTTTSDSTSQQQQRLKQQLHQGTFIETHIMRRVRHAEVVLVDRVSFRYQCYWLRLKWPGPQGGCAGYIALGEELGLKNFDRCMLTSDQEDVRHGENEENEEMGDEKGDDERRMEDAVSHHNEDTLQPSERSPPEGSFDHHVEDERFFPLEQQTTDTDGASATTGQASQSNSINSNNDGSNRNMISGESGSNYTRRPRCDSTGIYYPSSHEVELLAAYDDGLTALISSSDVDSLEGDSGGLEKVICRICREGLHDIDYDGSIQGGEEAAADSGGNRDDGGNRNAAGIDGNVGIQQPVVNGLVPRHGPAHTTVQVPPPRQQGTHTNVSNSPNTLNSITNKHPYAQNPLLSPCDCSGSMAFVHYLCIEQWRCRSRHPAARLGSHCETCRTPYTLPPRPPVPFHRDRGGVDPDDPNNDILEGMPPHVLHALRNPHLGWRIGSNLVRRRCLRPLAPILISPAVALYCRARRALKKRGVSRRRWACSLCRRRARWKCVRCLRSYYCSRQCQNVSWHIVHKHVCYKPVRFAWSIVVYGGLMLWFIPGISEYPLLYDLGLSFLWLSFGCMGILGGGVATALKKGLGLDIRGRTLEGIVVGLTLAFAGMLWGLIWGFFVGEEQCWGVADQVGWGQRSSPVTNLPQSTYTPSSWHLPHWGLKDVAQQEESQLGPILTVVQNYILHPGKQLVRMLDTLLLKFNPRVTRWLCMDDSEPFCLEITRNANPDFISPSREGGSQCGSDMHLAAYVFLLAFSFLAFGYVWKKRDWVLGGGRDLRMRGGGRRRRLGRRDNAAGALVIEPDAREGMDAGGRQRHAHHD